MDFGLVEVSHFTLSPVFLLSLANWMIAVMSYLSYRRSYPALGKKLLYISMLPRVLLCLVQKEKGGELGAVGES